MRERLLRLVGCFAVVLSALIATAAQSPPDERPRLKDFGSSLDRLKWDPEKLSAVEKKRRAKPGEAATDDVDLVVDFTRDNKKLKDGLDSLNRKVRFFQVGQSRQFSALMATVREMFTSEDIRRIIIFQTDGDEVAVLRREIAPVEVSTFRGDRLLDRNLRREFALRQFSLKDIYQAVEKSRASVYSVIPGPPLIEDFDEKVPRITDFRRYKHVSWHKAAAGAAIGGWPIYLPKPEDATAIYSKILADINSRYVIGYYPTNKVRDGKRRQVLVEARDRPEYSITGRKTYIAPDPEP